MSQNYANHTRTHAPFHLVAFPLLLVCLGLTLYAAVRTPSIVAVALLGTQVVLTITFFLLRSYALKVQDRVIRLEERLRLERLLPESLKSRIAELSVRQLVGLRFASDAELPELARRTLEEGLDARQIKQAVQEWRADTFRV